MININEVADEADVIINGYAFKRWTEGFRVLNLHRQEWQVWVYVQDAWQMRTQQY